MALNIDPARQSPKLPLLEPIDAKKPPSQDVNPQEMEQVHAFQSELKSTKQIHNVDERRLLLMLGDTFIENTPFEGGIPSTTHHYWTTLLKEMREDKSLIQNPLKAEQIDSILGNLDNCITADHLFDEFGKIEGEIGAASRAANMNKLLAIIDKQLNSGSRRFVLPLQHAGLRGKNGHVFCAILEKNKNNEVICTLVDKGEGSGMHRILTVSNKIKRTYRFDPIKLHDPKMFSPDSKTGLLFMNLLQQYRNPPKDYMGACQSKEIYYLFLQAGTLLEAPPAIDEDVGVTSQRSGTCSEQVVRLLIRDGLHRDNPSREATHLYKKVIFAGKFQILLDGYRSKVNPKLLNKAVEEFALSVLKLQDAGLLTREEWLKSYALIDLVRAETAVALTKLPEGKPLPPLVQEVIPGASYDLSSIRSIEKKDRVEIVKNNTPPILFEAPSPDTLLSYIKIAANKIQGNKNALTSYYQVVQLVRSLPTPSAENDLYWDKIPLADVPEVLSILYDLFEEYILLNYSDAATWGIIKKKDYKDLLLTHSSLFVMSDKLSRKLLDLKLESFNLTYNLSSSLSDLQVRFQIVKDHERIESIKQYIYETEKKNRLPIFKIRKTTFEASDIEKMLDNPEEPTSQHLKYSSQFIKANSNEEFLKKVLSYNDHDLPKQVRNLRILAHHSNLLMTCANHFADDISDLFYKSGFPKGQPYTYIKHNRKTGKCEFVSDTNMNNWFTFLEKPQGFGTAEQSKKYLLSNRLGTIDTDLILEMIKPDRTYRNENDVMVGNNNRNIPLHVYHDLTKISKQVDLQIVSVIRWCNDHKVLLEEQQYRTIVEALLSEGTVLRDQLKKEPLILESLRKMIKDQIQGLNSPENYQKVLWWLRLGYHIEIQAEAVLPDSQYSSQIKHFQNELDGLLAKVQKVDETVPGQKEFQDYEKLIRLHKIYFAGTPEILSDEQLIIFASNHIRVTYLDQTIPQELKWIEYEAHSIWEKHLYKVYQYIQNDPKNVQKLVNLSLMKLGIPGECEDISFEKWPWISFKVDQNPYRLNLSDGILFRNGSALQQSVWPKNIFMAFNKATSLEDILGRPLPKVTDMKSKYSDMEEAIEAEDGTFRILLPSGGATPIVEKKFTVNGKERTYQYLYEKDIGDKDEFRFSKVLNDKTAWVCEETPGKFSLFIRNKDGTLFAEGESRDGKITLFRTNSKGEKELFILLQSIALEKNNPWSSFIQSILNNDKISNRAYAWAIQKEGKFYLKSLEITQFSQLQFTLESKDGEVPYLTCNRFPEYQFSNSQGLFGQSPLEGVINLEKKGDPDKKGVLMLCTKFSSGQSLASPPEPMKEEFLGSEIDETYFFYEIDEKTGKMRCQSQSGTLYLIYVLRRLGEYQAATEYLEQMQLDKPLSSQDYVILKECSDNEDTSPEAAALNLKLALKVIENKDLQVFKKNLRVEIEIRFVKEYWQQLIKHFEKYLLVTDHPSLQDIPTAMRITDAEKKEILRYLEFLEIAQSYNLRLERNRQNKIGGLERDNSEILPLSYNIPQRLKSLIKYRNFKNLKLLENASHFNLSTPKIRYVEGVQAINSNFYALFKEAQTSTQEFSSIDLYLFTYANCPMVISKLSPQESISDLLAILYLVRLFPDKFSHIKLPSESDPFKEICQICYSIQEEEMLEKLSFGKEQLVSHPKMVLRTPTLSSKIGFGHSRELLPILPNLPFSVAFPMRALREKNFTVAREPILSQQEKFVLQERQALKGDKLVESLVSNLSTEYTDNVQSKTYSKYTFKEANIDSIQKELKKNIEQFRGDMSKLRNEIEDLANFPSEHEVKQLVHTKNDLVRYRMEQFGKQKNRLTLQDPLIISLIAKNKEFIREKNPYLSNQQIDELYQKILSYLLIGSALDQAKEALQLCSQKENDKVRSEIARVLDKKRTYDPVQHPELLLYEYATGLMLRNEPDQAKLLIEIFKISFSPSSESKEKLNKLFFEFQAGGGKTKVISTIIALKAVLEGKHPIFFSLPEIHDIAKKDLRDSFGKVFQHNVHEFNLGLGIHPSAQDLRIIYEKMKSSHASGTCEVITPETYHAWQLEYQIALLKSDIDKVKWLSLINEHFRTYGIAMIDESHRNADSLFQTNVATGEPSGLSVAEKDLFIDCYKVLLQDQRLGLLKNQQATISESTLRKVLNDLANYLLEYPGLNIPQENQDKSLKKYLLDESLEAPEWLSRWYNNGTDEEKMKAKLISLARGLLTQILPHVLTLTGEMDYGRSINPGDELDAPRNQKKPTTAMFELADIAATISIQGRFQRGISGENEMNKLIRSLKQQALKEVRYGMTLAQTPTARMFLEWQGDIHQKIELDKLVPERQGYSKLIALLNQTVGKNREAIEYYLRKFVLPQVQVYPNKYISTAQDLMSGFNKSILFSATLGSQEQYLTLGMIPERYMEDAAFQAEVIQRATLEHNRQMFWLNPSTPKKLFEKLYDKDNSLFDKLDGVLDMGGWNKNYSGFEVAQQFLEFSKKMNLNYDGVTYFQVDRGEKALYYLAKGANEGIRLDSTHIAKELARHGIAAKRVFKIYSPEDTTGTDLTLPPDAKMLFILGEGANLSLMVQSIMRMRQFLAAPIDPNYSQSIVWVGSKKLREKIAKETQTTRDQVNPVTCLEWGVLQEGERRKKVIVQRAFQEIQFVIRNKILQQIREKTHDPKGQVELFQEKKYEKAFLLDLGRDPYQMYALNITLTDIEPVLREYADKFALRACVDIKDDQRIEKIIQGTQKLVEKVSAPVRENLSSSAQMEQYAGREQDVQDEAQAIRDARDIGAFDKYLSAKRQEDYTDSNLRLDRPMIIQPDSKYHQTVNNAYATTIFSKDFGITNNAIQTVENRNLLKPVEYFMVIEEENERKALAVSHQDAVDYRAQIFKVELPAKRKVALFTNDGGIVQKGKFTADELKALRATPWFEEIVFEMGLLSCNIRDEERMKGKLMNARADCKAFFETLKTRFLDRDLIDDTYFEKLLKETPISEKPIVLPPPVEEIKEVTAPVIPPKSSPPVEVTTPMEERKSEENPKPVEVTAPAKKPTRVKIAKPPALEPTFEVTAPVTQPQQAAIIVEVPKQVEASPKPSLQPRKKETRGQFIRRSMSNFFKRHKWTVPFKYITLGILPLVLWIRYAVKYKR